MGSFEESGMMDNFNIEMGAANIEFMMLGYAIDFIMWTKAATVILQNGAEDEVVGFYQQLKHIAGIG